MSFQKGVSGNPSGRPPQDPALKSACQAFTDEGVKILIRIAKSTKSKNTDRIKAIEVILDRGFGKAIQPTKDLGQGESYAEFLKSLL